MLPPLHSPNTQLCTQLQFIPALGELLGPSPDCVFLRRLSKSPCEIPEMDRQMDGAVLSSTACLRAQSLQVFCWTKCVLLDQMVSSSSQIPSGADSAALSLAMGMDECSAIRAGTCPYWKVPAPVTGAIMGFIPSMKPLSK